MNLGLSVSDKVLVGGGFFLMSLFVLNMGIFFYSDMFAGLENVEDTKRTILIVLFGIGQMGLSWYAIEFTKEGLRINTEVMRK